MPFSRDDLPLTTGHLSYLLDTCGDGFIVCDEDQNIVLINKEADRIFGYDDGELLDQSIQRLMPERYRERHDRGFKARAREPEGMPLRHLELFGLKKNGEEFPIEMRFTYTPLGAPFFTASVRDVTTRVKERRELERRAAEIERLNAILSVERDDLREEVTGLRQDVHEAKQLGQYQLEKKLGAGGMGVVYRARHALLRRPAAVKLLHADLVGEASLARFEREVTMMSKLSHPNTVRVFDYGRTAEGTFYYAMELVDGATLSKVVEITGPMGPSRAAQILEEVAAALVEAHGAGLIHRDIKPANIMAHLPHRHGGIHEAAKVLDFGLVKESKPGAPELSVADVISGTPQYMAPEAIETSATVDGRSDIYSLGCVAYFLLTGVHVFEGTSVIDVLMQHMRDEPIPPSVRARVDIPKDFEDVVMQCLKKRREDRPKNALALQRAFRNCSCFGNFSPQDAQEWWDEYGAVLSDRATEPVARTGDYFTVDLHAPRQRT